MQRLIQWKPRCDEVWSYLEYWHFPTYCKYLFACHKNINAFMGYSPKADYMASVIYMAYVPSYLFKRTLNAQNIWPQGFQLRNYRPVPYGNVHIIYIRKKMSLLLFTCKDALNSTEMNQLWVSLKRAHTINLDHLSLLKTLIHKAPVSLNQQLLQSLTVINKILITSDNKHAMNLHFYGVLSGFIWSFQSALTPTSVISGSTA